MGVGESIQDIGKIQSKERYFLSRLTVPGQSKRIILMLTVNLVRANS